MNAKQLENLKDFVNNRFPDKLADYAYYDKDHDCNCVVGVMLVDVGAERESKYGETDMGVDYFYEFAKSKDSYHKSLYKKFLNHFGMEPTEITELQYENDRFMPDVRISVQEEIKQRALHIKKWLLNYIEEKEREINE